MLKITKPRIVNTLCCIIVAIVLLSVADVVCKRNEINSWVRPTVGLQIVLEFLQEWFQYFGYKIAYWLDFSWYWQKFKDILEWLFKDWFTSFAEIAWLIVGIITSPLWTLYGYMRGICESYMPGRNFFLTCMVGLVVSYVTSRYVFLKKKIQKYKGVPNMLLIAAAIAAFMGIIVD